MLMGMKCIDKSMPQKMLNVKHICFLKRLFLYDKKC